MRKQNLKITIILVLSLLISGFSLILNFDNTQVNSGVNEQWKNENNEKYFHPRLSDIPEGNYIHKWKPSEVTGTYAEGIETYPILTPLEDALRDNDNKHIRCTYPPPEGLEEGEPLADNQSLELNGYSNFYMDRDGIYKILIDLNIFPRWVWPQLGGYAFAQMNNCNFTIHCDNGLSEHIPWIIGSSFSQEEGGIYGEFINIDNSSISPIIIDENNFNQTFHRIREGGYIESISLVTLTYYYKIEVAGVVVTSSASICVDYIDIYYMWAVPPSPPTNLLVHQRIQHNYLTWDIPSDDGGGDITQYNVYRGTVEGGAKSYIGSSVVNNYNDTAVTPNVRYYYVIRAVNFQGESNNSNEANGMPRDQPFLEWRYPDENQRVILPVGDAVFNFRYDWGLIDDVELVINGINFGSIWNMNSIILTPYNSSIDGPVTAVLNGYIEGELCISNSSNFIFGKLTWEVIELLDEGTEFLGDQLYLILHDPNGDNSFSGFAEQTGLSFGVGSSVSVSTGFGIKVSPPLVGCGVGGSLRLNFKSTDKHDFRFEITEKTELTSSLEDSDKDYIGPGYGDTYWGEAWTINWQFKGRHRTYFNGTTRYEDPKLYYGIIRSGEVLLGDYNAPAEWRALNPVHNNWANVEWDDNITVDGGYSYSYTKEVTTSNTRTISFQMNLDANIIIKFPGVKLSFNFGLEIQTYMESEVTDIYTTSYTIYDDDSTDLISMQRGVDQTFGTPIFRTNPLVCKTSNPLEHNTIDYIPPVIAFPNIELDSNKDGIAPCEDDSPIVTVDIFDEGTIQSALIYFSINDGTSWDFAVFSEQIANPDTWEGLIPAQEHGTKVLWYIKVWDSGGTYSNRTDPNGNPFRYTVINRAPTILITTPNGNEVFENTVRIEWSAMDPDGDGLTFTIAYNLANTGWHLIESGVSGSYYDWDISGIDFCDTVLIRVTVDDGFGGSAYDESDYVFTIGEPEVVSSKTSEVKWTLVLVIAFISLAAAVSTIAIFIRRSRSVQE